MWLSSLQLQSLNKRIMPWFIKGDGVQETDGLRRRERASARQVAAASSEKRKSLAESLAIRSLSYSCSRCQWLVERLAHSNPKQIAKDGILYL